MKIKHNRKEVKLPDFLIVGAAKSGTTSLYYYLKQHPQIFLPTNKEPWFFSFSEKVKKEDFYIFNKIDIVNGFDDYLNLFKDAKGSQILGEASTSYLYLFKDTIENIKKYYPNWKELKIIIILRNPVERAFSHYLNAIAIGSFNQSFEKLIEKWNSKKLSKFHNYIDYGFYYDQIKSYKDNFDQVKILLFDDLREKSVPIIQDLFDLLGVDNSFYPDTSSEYNVSPGSRNKLLSYLVYQPNIFKSAAKTLLKEEVRAKFKNKIVEKFTSRTQIDSSSREFLREIYKEDVLKLQNLIERDLTPWL